MNYFILEAAVNTSETGPVYPQVQGMSPNYNYEAPNSVHALSRASDHFPTHPPNLNYFVVHNKANLTDLISVAVTSGGFLINNKLKMVFDRFNITAHQFYPARLMHRGIFYDNYFWIHFIQSDLAKFVDFKKSTFFIYHNYKYNLGFVKISSFDDLIQKRKVIKQKTPHKTVTIWAENICLQKTFDNKLDAFEIGTFDSNFYVSERLREALAGAKITGCVISLSNYLSICD